MQLCIIALCFNFQGFIPVANDVFAVESLIPAVWVATEDVNGDCEILPDYMLQIELVNTKVYSTIKIIAKYFTNVISLITDAV